MTQEQILTQVANLDWQFEFTDDLDVAVNSFCKDSDDYLLDLESKVKGIIQREFLFRDSDEMRTVPIRFELVESWQKELFEFKFQQKEKLELELQLTDEEFREHYAPSLKRYWTDKLKSLPNQHIKLGLKDNSFEDLKSMCFPISVEENEFLTLPNFYDSGLINGSKVDEEYFKYWITEWYKTFVTIRFFEDFNTRLGCIVVNVISFILTNKFLKFQT